MSTNIRLAKVCLHCHNEYIAQTTVTKYCSHKCASRAYKVRKREEKIKANTLSPTQRIKEINKKEEKSKINEREFLSIDQTCTLVGISRSTINRMFRKNILPYHKIGKKTIILRQDINLIFGI